MSRNQLIIFFSLAIISIILLILDEQTDIIISTELSSVLLFPVKIIMQYQQFLSVSRVRIEELEIALSKLALENTELKKNLALDTVAYKPTNFKLLKARVIGRDPADFNGYLYIDKGKEDSIYINQPVVVADRLVGKVKYVGEYLSIVVTLENRNIAISAVDSKTGVNGIVKYRDYLILDYIKITDEINISDSIYTSGMSEIFPPGLLIGTVKEVYRTTDLLFKNIRLIPGVQVNRLSYVYLVFSGKTTSKDEEFIKRTPIHERLRNLKLVIPEFGR